MARTPAQSALPKSSVIDRIQASLTRSAPIAGGAAVVGVIGIIVLPIGPTLLDALIVANLAASVLLVTMTLQVTSITGLSTFPSLLVVTTLLRLALNIASTKQILIHGSAGRVIETFGHLVMGGSVIVGLVAFTIIAIVQFIVISKGAERVAEVAARFSLDALPGRQMSIDADLRGGVIEKDKARALREQLAQESHLYGAMDGAMKFVKGDAIASILIAVVNLVGGIGVGMLIRDMDLSQAITRYTLLSIGDGMAAQIPSLLSCVAGAILVTRAVDPAGQASNLTAQVARQVGAQPVAMALGGASIAALSLVPGFPSLFFALFGGGLLAIGLVIGRRSQPLSTRAPGGLLPALASGGQALDMDEVIERSAIVTPLLLRVSPSVIDKVSPFEMQSQMQQERVQVHHDLGIPFPAFQIRIDPSLEGLRYEIDVQEVPMVRGTLPDGQAGVSQEGEVEALLARTVGQAVRTRPDAFVGMQEVQAVVKRAQAQLPDLSEEVLRAVSLQRLAELLRRLALEQVSLRYLREIYESVLVWQGKEKDLAMLCEYVRIDLARFITHAHIDDNRSMPAITVGERLEGEIRSAVQQDGSGTYLALEPDAVAKMLDEVGTAIESAQPKTRALVTTLETRRFLRRLMAQRFPKMFVFSYQELPPDVQLVSAAVVGEGG